jgi:hypothetical protein
MWHDGYPVGYDGWHDALGTNYCFHGRFSIIFSGGNDL